MKRKFAYFFALIFILYICNIPVFADDIPIGTDIGDVLATDIVAKINGYAIPSFNINNSMAVYAKHLNNYGFDVVWDGEKRQVNVIMNMDKQFEPIPTEEGTSIAIGSKLGDVLHTDIRTFFQGKEVQSFNINGSTAIYFRDLREFGTVSWDGVNRISSLTTDHPEYIDEEKVYEPSEVSKLVSPAVVYIETYDRYGFLLGSGSGFIVDKSGLVMTNYHVIDGAHSASIKLIDGRVFEMEDVLQYNIDRDVAVLKINGTALPVVKLGDSDKVESGEKILAIGSPIGLENTISDGLVSNKNRSIENQKFFQISAPISPGSSGGALLNYKAEVIGITTATFVEGQNLNLAIPINEVKSYITAALNNEKTANDIDSQEDDTISVSSIDPDYNEIVYANGDKYIGEVKYGLRHGFGTYYWTDGAVYEGYWAEDNENGEGIMSWSDGDKYKGNFVEGFREGYGTYTWSNGEQYIGNWKSGEFYGKGTYYYANGTSDSGVWYNSEYLGERLSTPTGVSAKAVSEDEVWVYWNEVYGAEYYHVYYSFSQNGTFRPVLDEDGEKSPFYPSEYFDGSIVGVGAETTIYIKVSAVIAGEESSLSKTVTATTFAVLEVPTGLHAEAISDSQIYVSWDKVEGADYYYLYRSISPNGPYYVYEDDNGFPMDFYWDTEYCVEVFGLEPGRTLYFKVTAVRGGVETDFSDVVSATTLKE